MVMKKTLRCWIYFYVNEKKRDNSSSNEGVTLESTNNGIINI
ncbi:hypothetical protein HT594_00096 [Phenacoccus solenopsis nudivirus]|nr:hypothetical protein HT594_00096 [Phenacoccus solenopsis nudivirus]